MTTIFPYVSSLHPYMYCLTTATACCTLVNRLASLDWRGVHTVGTELSLFSLSF